MSKVDDILRSTRPDGAFTMAMSDAKQQLLAEVLDMISSIKYDEKPSRKYLSTNWDNSKSHRNGFRLSLRELEKVVIERFK